MNWPTKILFGFGIFIVIYMILLLVIMLSYEGWLHIEQLQEQRTIHKIDKDIHKECLLIEDIDKDDWITLKRSYNAVNTVT